MTTQLKPCPFCGLQSHEDWDDTIYPAGIGWRDEKKDAPDGTPPIRLYLRREQYYRWQGTCYKINCAETYGGCGASLVGDSKEEAIDKWNRRVG